MNQMLNAPVVGEIFVKHSYTLPQCELKTVTTLNDAVNYLRESVFNKDEITFRESSYLLVVNQSNKVLGWFKLSLGGITGTIIDLRLLFNCAISCFATGIIIAHNHPSGNTKPSNADNQITEKIKEACNFLDIRFLDHIILTDNSYFSFADAGIL